MVKRTLTIGVYKRFLIDVIETEMKVIDGLGLYGIISEEEYDEMLTTGKEYSLWLLIEKVCREICARINEIRENSGSNTKKAIIQFVVNNCHKPDISLKNLADRFDLAVSTISSIFKELSGFNFLDFVNRNRIDIAKKLLESTKKLLQTLSYLPHFISTVIIVGIVVSLLSASDGVINRLIEILGGKSVQFLNEPEYFRLIYVLTGIWQSFGWSSILYLAAIANIDQRQYEAAIIDGANRMQQALYVTMPGIVPVIVLLLILSIGSFLSSDTEKILLLYNPATYDTADVIGTYTYRTGLQEGQFSYASAIGLFSTVVNFILLTISNTISRKVSDYSLW